MRLIQRYLFRQLLGQAAVATAAVTGVAILTASLSALDFLVNSGQSLVVFAELTALTTPQILALVLPIAVSIAGFAGLNRLQTEQEIVICFASGMSRWRVAAPAVRVAALATIANLVINLWLQPVAFREMRHVIENVRADIATSMIRPGEFTHPQSGLTVFAQSVDHQGAIHNLFINQTQASGESVTYMAALGRIAKRADDPVLIMRDGSIQQLSRKGALDVLYFDENVLDLKPFLKGGGRMRYRPSDRYLHELFFPDMRDAQDRAELKDLYSEGNARLATPLYNLAFMGLALAAVLGGAFSRLGYGARIAVAAGAAVVLRICGFVAAALAAARGDLNVLQYAPPILCCAVCLLIVLRQHPRRRADRAAMLVRPSGAPA